MRLRIVIIVVVLVAWEALAVFGLLYRDVVPSLVAIGRALYLTLVDSSFTFISTRRSTRSASPW